MSDRQSVARKPNERSLANLTGGSRKGIPNKTTKLAKEAIAEAFDRLGGADRLVEWAQQDPDNEKVFFTQLLPKLIPVQTEITGRDGAAIQVEQKVAEDAHAFRSRLLSGVVAAATAGGAGKTIQ